MKNPGFGLIGCGTWGSIHARAYAALPCVRFVATCDQDIARAARFSKEYGAETHAADWRDVVSNPEIQAVSIATPDFEHAEIVLAAIEAGKDILVEKPLATSIEECERIVELRRKKGVKLMVDFHNRWNLPFVSIRRALDAGELGVLLMTNIRLNDTLFVPTRMLSWAARSSPLHFLGSHVVDLIRWLARTEVTRVYSVSRSVVLKQAGIDTPDFYQSILELSNGGTAMIENCWIVSESAPSVFDFQCEFIGSKGSAYANLSCNRVVETYTAKGAGLPDVLGAPDLHGKPVGFAIAAIEHFVACVVNDTAPMVTDEDGLKAARVLAAIVESAETGRRVEVI
jgi:predicted dehydrogenase